MPGWLRVIESSDRIAPRVTSTSCLIPDAFAAAMRSRTSSRNRGSEVYWPMPSPWANGSDPRLRSCGRHPSEVVSRVTTSAPASIASARWIRLSTSPSSVLQ